MPGFTNNAKHSMLASLIGKASPDHTITELSIHTDNPGSTGANEVSGGGYARISVTESDFTDPSNGETTLNNDKEFDGPESENASYYGVWDGSTFLGGGSITGDTQFNAEGVFLLKEGTSLDLNS